MTTDLVPKTITPVEIFVPKGLDPVLAGVRAKVEEFDAPSLDMGKSKDRDSLRSFAADIGRSRKYVDDSRILYVKDKKAALKVIDQECKSFRDTMTEIQTTTRKPLTDYEDAEKIRVQKERDFEIYLLEWDDALAENDLVSREREMARKEAELAKAEEDRKAKEAKAQAEKDRLAIEERIKKEAAETAEREAKEKIQAEIDAKERAEREKKEAEEREEEARAQAERDRIQAAADAAEAAAQAERDQAAAVQKAKDDAAEKTRLEQLAAKKKADDEKAIADKKAANRNHQKGVNRKALAALMGLEIDEDTSKVILTAIIQGKIPAVSIQY